MKHYINKSDAIDALMDANIRVLDGVTSIAGKQYILESFRCARKAIEDMPTIDPVKHGHWKIDNGFLIDGVCSECGMRSNWGFNKKFPNCPYCRATMDVD